MIPAFFNASTELLYASVNDLSLTLPASLINLFSIFSFFVEKYATIGSATRGSVLFFLLSKIFFGERIFCVYLFNVFKCFFLLSNLNNLLQILFDYLLFRLSFLISPLYVFSSLSSMLYSSTIGSCSIKYLLMTFFTSSCVIEFIIS